MGSNAYKSITARQFIANGSTEYREKSVYCLNSTRAFKLEQW